MTLMILTRMTALVNVAGATNASANMANRGDSVMSSVAVLTAMQELSLFIGNVAECLLNIHSC